MIAHTTKSLIVVIGAAGNVGRGILESCCLRFPLWNIIAIDPMLTSGKEKILNIKSKLEDVDDSEFLSWFSKNSHVEFIYSSEDGNRENYKLDRNLGNKNDVAFRCFMERIASLGNESKTSVSVSYIGGSWTRMKPNSQNIVDESCQVKDRGGSNEYEKAKSSAEKNAKLLSEQYPNIPITFYDYISVVPNLAPNFSINQMTKSAYENGVIKFSSGDYGRPLLHSTQAGDFVASIIEKQITGDKSRKYEVVLVPGSFVQFFVFSKIAKNVVEEKKQGTQEITLVEYEKTPDELRVRCVSEETKSWFQCDESLIVKGLRESSEYTLSECM